MNKLTMNHTVTLSVSYATVVEHDNIVRIVLFYLRGVFDMLARLEVTLDAYLDAKIKRLGNAAIYWLASPGLTITYNHTEWLHVPVMLPARVEVHIF